VTIEGLPADATVIPIRVEGAAPPAERLDPDAEDLRQQDD